MGGEQRGEQAGEQAGEQGGEEAEDGQQEQVLVGISLAAVGIS